MLGLVLRLSHISATLRPGASPIMLAVRVKTFRCGITAQDAQPPREAWRMLPPATHTYICVYASEDCVYRGSVNAWKSCKPFINLHSAASTCMLFRARSCDFEAAPQSCMQTLLVFAAQCNSNALERGPVSPACKLAIEMPQRKWTLQLEENL